MLRIFLTVERMYDWIQASYSIEPVEQYKYIDKMIALTEVKNIHTNTVWTNGYLMNSATGRKMGVNISHNRIKIRICPNKFILGNNAQEAPINLVFNTLYDVSNTLGVDLGLFKLEQLDITHTAFTDFIPEMYYPYLCTNTGFTRWVQNTSLYYDANSDRITKVFYDKVQEIDKRKTWGNRQVLPDELKGLNLTRFECRLGSNYNIRQVIGGDGLLGQLFAPENVEKLQKWWLKQYNDISKTTEMKYNFKEGMNQKGVQNEIIRVALSHYGRLNIEELIEIADRQGAFNSRSQKSYTRKNLVKPFDEYGQKHCHIEELDRKYKATEPVWD